MRAGQSNGGDKWRRQALSIRLRAIMAEKNLSVKDTAMLVQQHLAGEPFNSVNITHYRAGRSLPRPRILKALSEALGVDPADLAPLPADDADSVLSMGGAGTAIETKASQQSFRRRVTDEQSIQSIPAFNLQDLLGGEAWLQINQRLSWPTVIKILQVLKGDDPDNT